MSEHALVLVKERFSDQQKTSEERAATEFERFLLALQARQQVTRHLSGDAIVWCDEPIEDILLSGIAVVLHAIATKYFDETLQSQAQVQRIVSRVDRLINAGIVLVYRTPEAAASAFEQNVLLLVRHAAVLGYLPGMNVPVFGWRGLLEGNESLFKVSLPRNVDPSLPGKVFEYWRVPCALFFSQLTKAAGTQREHLSILLREFLTLNRMAFGREFLFCVDADAYVTLFQQAIRYLDVTQEAFFPLSDMEDLEQKFRGFRQMCEIWRSFRIQYKDWGTSLFSRYLEREWFNTQILLAQTNADLDQDYLSGTESYVAALSSLKGCESTMALERVRDRLNKRLQHPLTSAQWSLLEKKIFQQIEVFLRWDPQIIDEHVLSFLLIRFSEKETLLDSRRALAIAKGDESSFFTQMRQTDVSLDQIYAYIASSIDWAMLLEEDWKELIDAHVLPPRFIVEGLKFCRPKFRTGVVKELLLDRDSQSSTIQLLIKRDLVQIDFDFLIQYVEVLPPIFLGDRLSALLHKAAEDILDSTIVAFWRALGRTTPDLAQRFVENEDHRTKLCMVVSEVITSTNQRATWKSFDDVRRNLGEQRYYELLFGAVAYAREDIRTCEDPIRLNAWKKTCIQGSAVFLHPKLLGKALAPSEIHRLLKTYSEQRARIWAKLP
ncbi:hypothetical protein HYV70_03910 [Candidatus Uhrbacteria bacterium]|nr:hypothetical protein [Candidatus Uhrbacteria bacterium]